MSKRSRKSYFPLQWVTRPTVKCLKCGALHNSLACKKCKKKGKR